MDRGFIFLWRKSLDSGFFKDHKLWKFWTYCLLKATHTDYTAVIRYQQIKLTPGQFVFGRKKAAEETGLTEREIRTCIAHLERCGKLTIKTTNKYSIITIVKWTLYQSEDKKTTSRTTSKRPASDHIQEHNNNKNKIYGEKLSDKETLSAYLVTIPEYQNLSAHLKEMILTYLNKVRQANKTKTLAKSKAINFIYSLNEISSKYGADNLQTGIEAVFTKEMKTGFEYNSHNNTAYIKAVAKSKHAATRQIELEEQAKRQKEQLRNNAVSQELKNLMNL